MSRADFHLLTTWDVPAPPERVWAELMRPQDWPAWWPAVTRADVIDPGDAAGVGSRIRFAWKTALPYRFAFEILTTRVEPLALIAGRASGTLDGTGCWRLAAIRGGTRVTYDWTVTVAAPGLRLVAPLARRAFAWNHDVVMRQGHQGLVARLRRG
ncbi:SRPBCC family protein [Rhodoplanes sp. SY1]|uniref:SRPBCC family protein n=1 Tax=Rhodoplanes sp. SY1 TaxID=3166646 RepID=UPI0038B58971